MLLYETPPPEIIGQAVKDYGVDHAPNVPWSQVAGMRNIIAHEYLGVDMVIVWETVKWNLPQLESAIIELTQHE